MRHGYAGRKLKRTASHRKAMLSNMASSLFEHKRVVTTLAKAKELRSFAEQLITRARRAYSAERAGTISGVDVHNRRMVGRYIKSKAVLQELFDTIAPMVVERNGGYTRITKLGQRRGDQAPEAVIELVDWSNPQDGRVSSKTRKTRTKPEARKPAGAQSIAAEAVPTLAEETAAPSGDTVEAADTAVAEEVAEVLAANAATADVESAEEVVAQADNGVEGSADEQAADGASEGDAPAKSDEDKPSDNA